MVCFDLRTYFCHILFRFEMFLPFISISFSYIAALSYLDVLKKYKTDYSVNREERRL